MVGPTQPPSGTPSGDKPPAAPVPAPAPPAAPGPISIEDFLKPPLTVGKVLECTDRTNANKLRVLKFAPSGDELRKSFSSLKQLYQRAQLVGTHVIVVAN